MTERETDCSEDCFKQRLKSAGEPRRVARRLSCFLRRPVIVYLYISVRAAEEREKPMKSDIYPYPLIRVTGGPGGEAVLITGSEKTALHDCGMACFSEELTENIKKVLGQRPLDYVILSHTHYDHMGALPYVIREWPDVTVCGNAKAAEVFGRPGALAMIESMGRTAAENYGRDPGKVTVEGLRIDRVVENADIIDLGEEKIAVFETGGHTDCSVSYFLQPEGILLASESTGIIGEGEGKVRTSILKSFDESLESSCLMKLLPYRHILIPHFGILPSEYNGRYFDMYAEAAEKEKTFIETLINKGLSACEIFEEHKKTYWTKEREKNQPYRAYKMNTEIIIKRMMKEAGK